MIKNHFTQECAHFLLFLRDHTLPLPDSVQSIGVGPAVIAFWWGSEQRKGHLMSSWIRGELHAWTLTEYCHNKEKRTYQVSLGRAKKWADWFKELE